MLVTRSRVFQFHPRGSLPSGLALIRKAHLGGAPWACREDCHFDLSESELVAGDSDTQPYCRLRLHPSVSRSWICALGESQCPVIARATADIIDFFGGQPCCAAPPL